VKVAWELRNLGKAYQTPQGIVYVVRNFSLRIEPGEFVCLVGHSGCGKSTVLSMVAGLSAPTEGEIRRGGELIRGPDRRRAMVFQSPSLLPWLSAQGNVLLAVEVAHRELSAREKKAKAQAALEQVGLEQAGSKPVRELSAGMKQRVNIARAFALEPELLLLDEPFGMLDSATRGELQDVLLALWSRWGSAALMVTHDLEEAIYLADRIVVMSDGPEATVGKIFRNPNPRPKARESLWHDKASLWLKEEIWNFLEGEAFRKGKLENSADLKGISPSGVSCAGVR
jgi:ABC-type nitrate/sulfonate/bicarbonate transport system ATPase subunit